MPNPRSPHVETRDVDSRSLLFFAGGLGGALVVIMLLLRLAFDAFPPPVPFGSDTGLAADTPALQPTPRTDRAAYEAEKAKELQATGWVDRSAGIARIPIGEAMQRVAAEGVPDWGQHAPPRADSDCARLAAQVPRALQVSDCGAAQPE